ncbi:hypothetical protein K2X85_20690 [bacterium]|nr:hypothetical protein [bacterium]
MADLPWAGEAVALGPHSAGVVVALVHPWVEVVVRDPPREEARGLP